MNKIIVTIIAVAFIVNFSGCAVVCNPQSPGAAISSGTQIGMVVGLAQFGACSAYYIAKKAIEKSQDSDSLSSGVAHTPSPTDALVPVNVEYSTTSTIESAKPTLVVVKTPLSFENLSTTSSVGKKADF